MSIFDFDFEALSIFTVLKNRAPHTIIKTLTGAFPLSWQDGIGGALVDYKIKGASEKAVTIDGVEYGVEDDVTLLESARANSVGFNLDFGIKPKLNTKVRFVFTPLTTNGNAFFGARKDADNVRFSATAFANGTKFAFALTKNTWSNNKTDLVLGQRYDCTAYNGKQIINGTEYTETVLTDLGQTDATFKIGAIDGTGNPSPSLVLDAKYEIVYIWEGETPVLLAHPAIKNNVVGYYDLLTGTFFSPSVGTLTAGKTTKTINVHSEIPEEYTELSYLGLASNAYFSSGVHANPSTTNSRLKVLMTDLSGTTALYGARGTTSSSTKSYNIFGAVSGSNGRFDNVNPSLSYGFTADTWYDIALGHEGLKGTVKVNDGTLYTGAQNMANEDVGEILIGTLNNINTPFTGGTPSQWAYVEISADGTTVDLKGYPVKRNSDDVVGFYNTIDGAFITPTSGTATAGSPNQIEIPLFHYRGVGDKTDNMFNPDNAGTRYPNGWFSNGNVIADAPNANRTVIYPCSEGDVFTFKHYTEESGARYFWIYSDTVAVGEPCSAMYGTVISINAVTTNPAPSNAKYIGICFWRTTAGTVQSAADDFVVVKGSTAPTEHIPFGYDRHIVTSTGVEETHLADYHIYTDEQGFSCGAIADEVSYLNGDVQNVGHATLSEGTHSLTGAKTNGAYITSIPSSGTLTGTSITIPSGYGDVEVLYELATPVTKQIAAPTVQTQTGDMHFDVVTETEPSGGEIIYRSGIAPTRDGLYDLNGNELYDSQGNRLYCR